MALIERERRYKMNNYVEIKELNERVEKLEKIVNNISPKKTAMRCPFCGSTSLQIDVTSTIPVRNKYKCDCGAETDWVMTWEYNELGWKKEGMK
jgi:hypothetical protein